MQAKPFLKWVGGKTQLLPELFKLFPKKCRYYYEPFLGGGAAFFAYASSPEHSFEHAILNDYNVELSIAYKVVRDYPVKLGELLGKWREEYMKDPEPFYYKLRGKTPADLQDSIEQAARMIFLNKTGFNGLYRVNRKGGFNVPFGKHKNPAIYDPEVIGACSKALQGTAINTGDFMWVTDGAIEGDLVYFDPPYVPLNPTSNFTSYTSDGFTGEDQKRLANEFTKLAARGVTAFLSNSDTPFVRDLYKDFEIVTVSARRNVNSKGSGRGPVSEVIVTSRAAAASGF